MKQWLVIFSAVLAAGVIVFGLFRWNERQNQLAFDWDSEASETIRRLKQFSDVDAPPAIRDTLLSSELDLAKWDRSRAPSRAHTATLDLELGEATRALMAFRSTTKAASIQSAIETNLSAIAHDLDGVAQIKTLRDEVVSLEALSEMGVNIRVPDRISKEDYSNAMIDIEHGSVHRVYLIVGDKTYSIIHSTVSLQ